METLSNVNGLCRPHGHGQMKRDNNPPLLLKSNSSRQDNSKPFFLPKLITKGVLITPKFDTLLKELV
ncbi:hypothetical protein V6N13_005209 [Hibiscus sabdariffa]